MTLVMNIVLAIGIALLAFSLYLMLWKGTPRSKQNFDDSKEKEKRRVARSLGLLALVTDGLFLGASYLLIKGYTWLGWGALMLFALMISFLLLFMIFKRP